MRVPLVLSGVLLLAPLPFATADEPQTRPDAVGFDTKLSFACREVTPKDFASANTDRKIVEASLRISANFAVDEKTLDCIVYRLKMPAGVEIADYLPKTRQETPFAGPITTEEKSSTRRGLVVSVEGGGKVGYHLPAVVSAEAGGSAQVSGERSNEVSSGVQVQLLPPKELVMAAGTENRGQTLYFKLRPFSQITLEGEKEFTCLLIVPKEWTGDCVTLDCTAVQKESRAVVARQVMGVGLYAGGDAEARARVEKAAREVVPPSVAAAPQPTPAGTAPAPAPAEALPIDGTWSWGRAGKVKIEAGTITAVENPLYGGKTSVPLAKELKFVDSKHYTGKTSVLVSRNTFKDVPVTLKVVSPTELLLEVDPSVGFWERPVMIWEWRFKSPSLADEVKFAKFHPADK